MWILLLSSITLGTLFLFQNCSQHSFDASSSEELNAQEEVVASQAADPVRVILLVDDSYTMKPMQELLSKGIQSVAEKRLLGTAVSVDVYSTSTSRYNLPIQQGQTGYRQTPKYFGRLQSASFSIQNVRNIMNWVAQIGIMGSSDERIRHRLATILADDRPDRGIQKGDRVAIVMITDEDDSADGPLNVPFSTLQPTGNRIKFKFKSTVINFSYSRIISDGPNTTGKVFSQNRVSVEPDRFTCAGSSQAQQLEVIRRYYIYNPDIGQNPDLAVLNCLDNQVEESLSTFGKDDLVNVGTGNVFESAPKFTIGSQEFGCQMTNFQARFSKTETNTFARVEDFFDSENQRIRSRATNPTDFGYYAISNRFGDCLTEVSPVGVGIGTSLSERMQELSGTTDVNEFIQRRLQELTGGAFHISSIVTTDASKLQGDQSVGNGIIKLTRDLGGKILSIHSADYSEALNPVAEFVLREARLKYPVAASTLSILKGVKIIRNSQEILMKNSIDYRIEGTEIIFSKGSIQVGDRIILDLFGAK